MPYMIKCWIPIEAEDPQVYKKEGDAGEDWEQATLMQPENKYEVVECDEDGQEI